MLRSVFTALTAPLGLPLLGILLLAGVAGAHGARCGHRVIDRGDHQFEVLQRCGEPDYATTRIAYPYRLLGAGLGGRWGAGMDGGPGGRLAVVQIRALPELIEEWVYAGSGGHFGQLLRFSNGRLIDVESLAKPPAGG